LSKPSAILKAGEHRVLSVDFHPVSANVLLSF